MGLTSALHVGRSALNYAQAALQVTGNNMANATTPGFTRQTAIASPMPGDRLGPNAFVGGGVNLSAIQRHIDEAIQTRLRSALGDERHAGVMQNLLNQVESLQNELTDSGISSGLSRFFNAWSEMANNPTDAAVRSLVVQEGANLAAQVQGLRRDYLTMRDQIDRDLGAHVKRADDLLSQIASLNEQIVRAEGGRGPMSSLRDQRDALLDELSGLMSIRVVEQPAGTVDVLVGSIPVVYGTESRGVELDKRSIDGELVVSVRVKADGSPLSIEGGAIGALKAARDGVVTASIADLDEFAAALIHSVNRVHSQGQGDRLFRSVTATYRASDPTAALNTSMAGLPFEVVNGSVMLHLTHQTTQERTSHRIDVNLNGTGSDMSLDDFVAAINAAAGPDLTAGITADGRLHLEATEGFRLSFSDDTSGILAALGINTYFTGTDARDIAIHQRLLDDPAYLAVGAGHIGGSNGTALKIAALKTEGVAMLDGRSLTEAWTGQVQDLAVRTGAANGRTASTVLVREALEAQRAAVSGVSLDEEAVNLMNYQQQYEAAARFISVIDEMMRVLMRLV